MSFILDLIKTFFLSIIQGITEWLPISSTGHMSIFNSIWPVLPAEYFSVLRDMLQLGSILAVVLIYYQRLNPWAAKKKKKREKIFELWIKILFGVLPFILVHFLLENVVETYLMRNFVIAVSLIAYGIIMIVYERLKKPATIKKVDSISIFDAFKIGLFQTLSIIPGTSRSLAAILGSMSCGCSRTVSCEFSFLLAVPTVLITSISGLLGYIGKNGFFGFSQFIMILIGMFVSFVVSVIIIQSLLRYVKRNGFAIFGWYRILLGIFIIFFFYVL